MAGERIAFSKCVFLFFFFLGLHLEQVEVPSLAVKLERQLLAYVTDTATPDPSPTEQGLTDTVLGSEPVEPPQELQM